MGAPYPGPRAVSAPQVALGAAVAPQAVAARSRLASPELIKEATDAGESDPEIYHSMAKAFPKQIAYILIRAVRDNAEERQRLKSLFADRDPATWSILRDKETDIHSLQERIEKALK